MKEQLQKFSEDKNVQELQKYILAKNEEEKNKFNIFKILKLHDYEIRHSNFLAWLFDPKASHGFGTTFLENCLKLCFGNENISIGKEIKIETEYLTNKGKKIDILIHSDTFVCVIENKYGSVEHDGQCEHYKKFINGAKEFKKKEQKFIFLDIYEPDKDQFQKNKPLYGYKSLTYKKILAILENLINRSNLDDHVKKIIEQYINIIKEKYPMIDEKTVKLCREIYKEHKEAIDLINKYNANSSADIIAILKEIIEEKHTFIEKWSGNNKAIFFFPKDTDGNVYLQFIVSKNTVALELVTPDEKDLSDFINKKLGSRIRKGDGFNIIPISTFIAEKDYCETICLEKEQIKNKLKKEFESTNIINSLSKILNEYNCVIK